MLADLLSHIYRAPLRTRRLYAISTLVLAVAGLAAILLTMFAALETSYAELQSRRTTLGNMVRMIQAGTENKGSETKGDDQSRRVFLEGTSSAVVAANLQSWLGGAAQETGAQLQSVEINTLSETDAKSYVGLSANIVGNWTAVQGVIFRIETAEPALTIQSVDLQSYSYGAPDEMEPSVTMQVAIRGAINPAGP